MSRSGNVALILLVIMAVIFLASPDPQPEGDKNGMAPTVEGDVSPGEGERDLKLLGAAITNDTVSVNESIDVRFTVRNVGNTTEMFSTRVPVYDTRKNFLVNMNGPGFDVPPNTTVNRTVGVYDAENPVRYRVGVEVNGGPDWWLGYVNVTPAAATWDPTGDACWHGDGMWVTTYSEGCDGGERTVYYYRNATITCRPGANITPCESPPETNLDLPEWDNETSLSD